MTAKPWYSNGLRFECTQCGKCCKNHGGYEFVYLTEVELEAIPRFLGLSREEFIERYCEQEPGQLYTLRTDHPACPFLQEDNRCGIYSVRPKQCATWPFWKENLRRAAWEGPVKACCPGIDRGPLTSSAEVELIAQETEQWYR